MDTIHELTEEVLSKAEYSEDDRYWLTIAIREAITNAVKHGNKMDAEKCVDVEFHLNDKALEVKVIDHGEGFDPDGVPSPLLPENLLKEKGRGIYYIKTFMDEFRVESSPRGRTTVTLMKKRP